MDASGRSSHVYGKTQAGTNALNATRGTMSSSVRQLLILIDGQRSVGELSKIFPQKTLASSLAHLESQGLIECLQHFPDAEAQASSAPNALPPAAPAAPAAEASAPSAAPMTRQAPETTSRGARQDPGPARAAPRRTAAIAIGACCIAVLGVGGYGFWSRRDAPGETSGAAADSDKGPASQFATKRAPAPDRVNAERESAIPPAAKVSVPAAGREQAADATRPLEKDVSTAAARAGTDAHAPASEATSGPTLHVRNQVMPQLPRLAEALGIVTGHVVVVLRVNPHGTVDRVELVSATPPQVYDQAMEEAFRQWTFDALGVPGRMTVEIEVKPPAAPP